MASAAPRRTGSPASRVRGFGMRGRSTTAAVLVVAVALGGVGVLVVWLLRANLMQAVDQAVTQRAADVAAQIAGEEAADALPNLLATTQDGTLLQVLTPAGEVLFAAPALAGAPPLTAARPGPDQWVWEDVSTPQRFRVAALGVQSEQGPVVVIAAQSSSAVDEVIRSAAMILLGVAPLLLAAVAITTWLAVGRSLRAVEEIRVRVGQITEADLHRRVPVPAAADEIARLAQTMNQMLDRLEAAATTRRRFVSDASHELRSPLASLLAAVDVAAAAGTLPAWQEAQPVLAEEIARMSALVADLLLLARADEGALHPNVSAVDLDDLVLAEQHRLRGRGGLDVTVQITAVQVRADSGQLVRALRNLGDNAARYANSQVRISVLIEPSEVGIEVADDGPGIPAAERERVLDRFVRLDTDRSRAVGGTGLGLAIVAEIARANGGRVRISQSAWGGAAVAVLLPRSGAESR